MGALKETLRIFAVYFSIFRSRSTINLGYFLFSDQCSHKHLWFFYVNTSTRWQLIMTKEGLSLFDFLFMHSFLLIILLFFSPSSKNSGQASANSSSLIFTQ